MLVLISRSSTEEKTEWSIESLGIHDLFFADCHAFGAFLNAVTERGAQETLLGKFYMTEECWRFAWQVLRF
jgi:hypothetical protein